MPTLPIERDAGPTKKREGNGKNSAPEPRAASELLRRLFKGNIHYEIFYGVSDNNYHPHHKADDYRDASMTKQTKLASEPIGTRFQGEPFATSAYDAHRK